MRKHIFWAAPMALAAVAATAALAGSETPADRNTPQGKATGRQCFYTRDVTSFAAPNEKTLNVRVRHRDVFQFEMFGICSGIDWNQEIALVSRGSNQICAGVDADVITPTPIGPQRCSARNMRKLTPEEVAALPRMARP